MLSPEQIEQYHADGFLVLKGVFSPEEIARFIRAADGFPDEPMHLRCFHELPELEYLWRDERLLSAAEDLIGGPLIYFFSGHMLRNRFDLSNHNSGRHLHHDAKGTRRNVFSRNNGAMYYTYPVTRIIIYLQDTAHQSGGLKVVPGSHLVDVNAFDDSLQFHNVASEPGDVVIFTHRILHSPYALRPKDDPSSAISPHQEYLRLETAPDSFLPIPAHRDAIFIDYAIADEMADLFIKNRALVSVAGLREVDPAFPEYLVKSGLLTNADTAPVKLRVDQAIVDTVLTISHHIARGDQDATNRDLLKLPVLCRVNHETSVDFTLCNTPVPDDSLETATRLFNEILPRITSYTAFWDTRSPDRHMAGYDRGKNRMG